MQAITDAEVRAFFQSDRRLLDSRLGTYIDFCSWQTDAPLVYHAMAGLGLLSALAPPSLRYFTFGSRTRAPQVWAVLLGRSTADRKTTAIRIAHDLLLALAPERDAGPIAGSAEALIDSFAKVPQQTMVLSEFSSFLEMTAKPMYAQMRNILIQAYDGERLGRNLVGGSSISDMDVRSTIIAGLSYGYYDELISESAATGGFLARLGQVIGRREGEDRPEAPPDPVRYAATFSKLAEYRDAVFDPAAMNVGWSPDADRLWAAFTKRTTALMVGQKDAVVAVIGRARELARNVAVLMALDLGAVNFDRSWVLTELPTRVGITVGTWVIRSSSQMLMNLADTRFRRDRRTLLNLFQDRPLLTHQGLSAAMLVDQRYLNQLIQALMAEGRLTRMANGANAQDVVYFTRSQAQVEYENPDPALDQMAHLIGTALPANFGYDTIVRDPKEPASLEDLVAGPGGIVVRPVDAAAAAALAAQDTRQAVELGKAIEAQPLPNPLDSVPTAPVSSLWWTPEQAEPAQPLTALWLPTDPDSNLN